MIGPALFPSGGTLGSTLRELGGADFSGIFSESKFSSVRLFFLTGENSSSSPGSRKRTRFVAFPAFLASFFRSIFCEKHDY